MRAGRRTPLSSGSVRRAIYCCRATSDRRRGAQGCAAAVTQCRSAARASERSAPAAQLSVRSHAQPPNHKETRYRQQSRQPPWAAALALLLPPQRHPPRYPQSPASNGRIICKQLRKYDETTGGRGRTRHPCWRSAPASKRTSFRRKKTAEKRAQCCGARERRKC
jgi:hypothetical protein